MLGVFFSGTGNSRYCVELFVKKYDNNAITVPIEDSNSINLIRKNNVIVIGYPVQYSNIPKILKDFVINNSDIWKDKNVYIIATMALFSGDGAGVLARLLKKYNANIIGGLHLKMPDSICDEKVLKFSNQHNEKIISSAEQKIEKSVHLMKKGVPTQEGLKFYNYLIGALGQRIYFYKKVSNYSSKLKIDNKKCVACKKCVNLCPMKNISIKDNCAIANNKCTMCYRCISKCPKQAITLLGDKVVEQYNIDRYR